MRRKRVATWLWTAGLLSLLPGSAAAVGLARGPYLQQTTTTEVTVVFDLDEPDSAEVRFGQQAVDEQVTTSQSSGTHHEVRITGLAPNTQYVYAVEVSTGLEGYQEYSLQTAVEADEPFSLIVMGDTRSDHDQHAIGVTAMLPEDVRLMINTGDLVADGEVSEQWDTFFEIETPLISEIPLFPVVGNHDDDGEGAVNFREAFALPNNELYYSFDYGNVHFVMLDGHASTEIVCERDGQLMIECFDEPQLQWLEADLSEVCGRTEPPWIFVAIHAGPFSSEPNRTGNGQMRDLLPLFAQSGVTAIFSGHDHYYERGASEQGIPYVITGGAGAGLYDIDDPCPFPHTVATNASEYHYVVLEVGSDAIRLTAKRPDGTVLDEAVIDTPRGCRPPETAPPTEPAAESDGGCGCRVGSASTPGHPLWLGLVMLAGCRRRRAC